MSNNIETAGEKIDEIPVEISFRIIELFSAGLYSSPNKAFEELVSNSYDAFANKVCVSVPSDATTPNSFIWVCDNGESMDADGLKQLWKIGSSNKLKSRNEDKRLQIGKFGIGKLATYVLARKLTYICKTKEGDYLAVTMDYSRIDKNHDSAEILLDERKLKLDEVKEILEPFLSVSGHNLLDFELWGDKAEKTWTFCIMTELTPKSAEIKLGRLKWILSTALPINPNFSLLFNGAPLLPSKIDDKALKTWVIGKDDETANKFFESNKDLQKRPVVNFENLKNVRGEFELFEDSLVAGKSTDWGRSNGIFLMVRGRLVNMDDGLLGMDAFQHGTFNRLRVIIHADGLDDKITSTRESIQESKPLAQLRDYLKKKFNREIKPFWEEYQKKEDNMNRASSKLFNSSGSLSRRPLLALTRKYFDGSVSSLMYTIIPDDLTEERKSEILKILEDDLTSETGIIKDVVAWEIMNPDDPIAKFDLISGKAKINLLHPFFANFSDEIKTTLPFELIALAEILTEAHLIELGVSEETTMQILKRRDQLLREFTYSDRPNAPGVAIMLRDSLADSIGLENAVYHAFNNLGYETTQIGGKGTPDGRSVARLGYKIEGVSSEYSLIYDAKSTSKERISSATAKMATSVRHRNDYKANYSCVVARDFEGADDFNSAINTEAKQQKVSLFRVKDLIKLLLVSAPKQLGLLDLEDLFKNCHTVIETSEWISKLEDKEIKKGPIKELLETVFLLQKDDTEPAELAAIRHKMKDTYPHLNDISKEEIRSLVLSLERLVPGYLSLENEIVSIQAKPDKILDSITHVTAHDIAPEFRSAYISAFDNM
jgi:hypothetical protein